MVDDEVEVDLRLDAPRITTQRLHRLAHRRQVAEQRDAGGVGHHHPCGTQADRTIGRAAIAVACAKPGSEPGKVFARGLAERVLAQQVLEHDLEHERQAGNALEPIGLRGGEAEVIVLPVADLQRTACPAAVAACRVGGHRSSLRAAPCRGLSQRRRRAMGRAWLSCRTDCPQRSCECQCAPAPRAATGVGAYDQGVAVIRTRRFSSA